MRRNIFITCMILIVISLFTGYVLGSKGYLIPNKENLLIQKTISIIESYYYKPADFESIAKSMVDSLGDPYTALLNPDETKALEEEVKGEYYGIGIIIQLNETYEIPEIIGVFPNSPAEKAGIIKGDLIKSVNSESIKGLSLEEASLKIKGKAGTTIDLEVLRGESTMIFTVERSKIDIPITEVKYFNDNTIGYLKLNLFSEGLNDKVVESINEFKSKKVKGVIIDLRDNPGGLLTECQKVASNFIPSGVLVWTRNRSGDYSSISIKGTQFSLPLVVLVNGGSASASEILASAIKYYNVGKIVGEKTYGKGLIQQIFYLNNGYSIKITVEEYLTPDKREINAIGVITDVEVKNDPTKPSEDYQLQKALEILGG